MEVKQALFDMAPLKIPRVDGYHAMFFWRQWDTVGNSISEMVRGVSKGDDMELAFDKTLIVLISKVPNLQCLAQFRSIIVHCISTSFDGGTQTTYNVIHYHLIFFCVLLWRNLLIVLKWLLLLGNGHR